MEGAHIIKANEQKVLAMRHKPGMLDSEFNVDIEGDIEPELKKLKERMRDMEVNYW